MNEETMVEMPNKVSVWEERTVNLGNYESKKMGISFSYNTKHINYTDQKIAFETLESESVHRIEDMEKVADKLIKSVDKKLSEREAAIRNAVENFDANELPFSPKAKGQALGVYGDEAKEKAARIARKKAKKKAERKKKNRELMEKLEKKSRTKKKSLLRRKREE